MIGLPKKGAIKVARWVWKFLSKCFFHIVKSYGTDKATDLFEKIIAFCKNFLDLP